MGDCVVSVPNVILKPPNSFAVGVLTTGVCLGGFLSVGSSSVQLGSGVNVYTESPYLSASLGINQLVVQVNKAGFTLNFNYPTLCATTTPCIACWDFYNMVICQYPWMYYVIVLLSVTIAIKLVQMLAGPVKYFLKCYSACRSTKVDARTKVDNHPSTNTATTDYHPLVRRASQPKVVQDEAPYVTLKKLAVLLASTSVADAWGDIPKESCFNPNHSVTNCTLSSRGLSKAPHSILNRTSARVNGGSRRLAGCPDLPPLPSTNPFQYTVNGDRLTVTFVMDEGCNALRYAPGGDPHILYLCIFDLVQVVDFTPAYDFAASWTVPEKPIGYTTTGEAHCLADVYNRCCREPARHGAVPVAELDDPDFINRVDKVNNVISDATTKSFWGSDAQFYCAKWFADYCSGSALISLADYTITEFGEAYTQYGTQSVYSWSAYMDKLDGSPLESMGCGKVDLDQAAINIEDSDGNKYTFDITKIAMTDLEADIDSLTFLRITRGPDAVANQIYMSSSNDNVMTGNEQAVFLEGCARDNYHPRTVNIQNCEEFFTYGLIFQGFRIIPHSKLFYDGDGHDITSYSMVNDWVPMMGIARIPIMPTTGALFQPIYNGTAASPTDEMIVRMCWQWYTTGTLGFVQCLVTMLFGSMCSGLESYEDAATCFLSVSKNTIYQSITEGMILDASGIPLSLTSCYTGTPTIYTLESFRVTGFDVCSFAMVSAVAYTVDPPVTVPSNTVKAVVTSCLETCYDSPSNYLLTDTGKTFTRTAITFEDQHAGNGVCGFAQPIPYTGNTEWLCKASPYMRWAPNQIGKITNDYVRAPETILSAHRGTAARSSVCDQGSQDGIYHAAVWPKMSVSSYPSLAKLDGRYEASEDSTGRLTSISFYDTSPEGMTVVFTSEVGNEFDTFVETPPTCPEFVGCYKVTGTIQSGASVWVNVSDSTAAAFGGVTTLRATVGPGYEFEPFGDVLYFPDPKIPRVDGVFIMEVPIEAYMTTVLVRIPTVDSPDGCVNSTPFVVECVVEIPSFPEDDDVDTTDGQDIRSDSNFEWGSLSLGLGAGISGLLLIVLLAICLVRIPPSNSVKVGKSV